MHLNLYARNKHIVFVYAFLMKNCEYSLIQNFGKLSNFMQLQKYGINSYKNHNIYVILPPATLEKHLHKQYHINN